MEPLSTLASWAANLIVPKLLEDVREVQANLLSINLTMPTMSCLLPLSALGSMRGFYTKHTPSPTLS